MRHWDVAIGNPPYQNDMNNDNKLYAEPVYNIFMEAAYSCCNIVELITPARFLFNAGQTPKAWNEKMLHDPHFKVLYYEADANKVFSNVGIAGGVAISYRDIQKDFGEIGIFIPFNELNSVGKKVLSRKDFQGIDQIIYKQNKFDLHVLYSDHPEYKQIIGSDGKDKRLRSNTFKKLDIFSEKMTEKGQIPIYGVDVNRKTIRYIPKKYLEQPHENLDKWKVLQPSASGFETLGQIGMPFVVGPNTGFTQTYISFGAFDDESEAQSCMKYIKSKFCRAMLGTLKVTQDAKADKWINVPLQDFSDKSDIDWSVSIPDIDKQLYKKYGLSQEEIDFIETHVKEME